MNVLVVGAGLSGVTIGDLFSDENKVTIIDSSSEVGGNCYDYVDKNGITVHKYGSHIFHTSDPEVWDYLSSYTSFNNYVHKVLVNINEELVVPLPFNFNSIRAIFPASEAELLINRLLTNYPYGSIVPIIEFAKQNDGELKKLFDYIYENIYFYYTYKQWGQLPNYIDQEVLSRVPISISDDNCYFQDSYQGIPTEGYTSMIRKMIDRNNIKLKVKTPFKNEDSDNYDMIFYTGSVDELLNYCYGILPYRSVRFEIEEYDTQYYQENAVINYPNNHDYTRIHEYKYYLNDKSDKTVIAKEYSEPFVPGKNRRSYPIRNKESTLLYEKYLEEAKKKYPNMYFLGRLGDYKYYDMDDSVRRAIDLYREVIG